MFCHLHAVKQEPVWNKPDPHCFLQLQSACLLPSGQFLNLKDSSQVHQSPSPRSLSPLLPPAILRNCRLVSPQRNNPLSKASLNLLLTCLSSTRQILNLFQKGMPSVINFSLHIVSKSLYFHLAAEWFWMWVRKMPWDMTRRSLLPVINSKLFLSTKTNKYVTTLCNLARQQGDMGMADCHIVILIWNPLL